MADDVEMVETWINGRWPLLLPRHRAERVQWPWWEAARLSAMHHVISRMTTTLSEKPLVWDVGAEEGDLPALWASWGADVGLFEPNPRVWPNIKAIFDANHLPIWCAFEGFAAADTTTGGWGVWPESASGPVISDHGFMNLCERPDVPRVRLDDIPVAYNPHPDVVTVDVEGAEWEVLKGAVATLTDQRPVLFLSVHPQFMRDMYQQDDAEMWEWLEGFGYVRQFLATDHEQHWCVQHPDNMWLPVDR